MSKHSWWPRRESTPLPPAQTDGHWPHPYTEVPPKSRPAETDGHWSVPVFLGTTWIGIGIRAGVTGNWPLLAVAVLMTGLMAYLLIKRK